jgi:hypothetical protein
VSDHEFEPVPGLPERLPKGERMLWQGAPHWRPLALRAFRLRAVMIYFAGLMAWRIGAKLFDGASLAAALDHAFSLVPLALGAIAILLTIAIVAARTTMYTITDRRIVLRFGMALPLTLNIPFDAIESAALGMHGDRSGDLALTLRKGERLGYLLLWPHVRPWHYARPEPLLRCLADPQPVAEILADALALHAQMPRTQTERAGVATPAQGLRGTPAALAS